MLYDDLEQMEVRHVISLKNFQIDIYAGGSPTLEGNDWPRTNAIRLQKLKELDPAPSDLDRGPDSLLLKSAAPYYLYIANSHSKEEFLQFFHSITHV